MNTTRLTYEGKVSLSFRIGNKLFKSVGHNSGCPALKQLFAKALTGAEIRYEDVPRFMDLRVKGADDTGYTSVLFSRVPISGKKYSLETVQETGEKVYLTVFTGVLRFSNIMEEIQVDQSISYEMVLCTDNNDFAEMPVIATDLTSITEGVEAVIEWSLYVENKVEETE